MRSRIEQQLQKLRRGSTLSNNNNAIFVALVIAGLLSIAVYFSTMRSFSSVSNVDSRAMRSFSSVSNVDSRAISLNTKLGVSPTNNDNEMPTFVVVCGNGETNAVDEMQPLLKSMILLASMPFRVIFVTDPSGVDFLETVVVPKLKNRKTMLQQIHVHTVVSFEGLEAYADKIELDVHVGHHSGPWGMIKLFTPWMLHAYDQFVILDTDLIFVQDPILLWREFDALQSPYSMPLMPRNGTLMTASHHMCSCVVLIQAKQVRDSQVLYPDQFREGLEMYSKDATSGKYKPAHGDQSVYFQMFKKHMDLVTPLNDKWNVDNCHQYAGVFLNESDIGDAGILHRNCAGNDISNRRDSASSFFEFFQRYPYHWLSSMEGETPSLSLNITNSSWLPVPEGVSTKKVP